MNMKQKPAVTLKNLSKGNVWDLQENDLFRLWETAGKNADLKDNMRHYFDIFHTAFEIEEVKVDKPEVVKKYEARGFKTDMVSKDDGSKVRWAVKKRPIQRITDLTYENIRHISAAKLMEILDRNFGGGWDSLPQSVQDIIESGFEISTTTLPKDRLKKEGGMYEKKVNDGFEVLEIPKGTWVEAIFAKVKPLVEIPKPEPEEKPLGDEDDNDEDLPEETKDEYNEDDEDDFDDDKLTEESYRTTYEENPEDLDLEAEDVSDDGDYE